jgi:hypothetical protein
MASRQRHGDAAPPVVELAPKTHSTPQCSAEARDETSTLAVFRSTKPQLLSNKKLHESLYIRPVVHRPSSINTYLEKLHHCDRRATDLLRPAACRGEFADDHGVVSWPAKLPKGALIATPRAVAPATSSVQKTPMSRAYSIAEAPLLQRFKLRKVASTLCPPFHQLRRLRAEAI